VALHPNAGVATARTGDDSTTTQIVGENGKDDDSTQQKFLRNIKSKLTFPYYYSEAFRRKKTKASSSTSIPGRGRWWIGSVLQRASSGVWAPLRWVQRRVLRRTVHGEDGGSGSGIRRPDVLVVDDDNDDDSSSRYQSHPDQPNPSSSSSGGAPSPLAYPDSSSNQLTSSEAAVAAARDDKPKVPETSGVGKVTRNNIVGDRWAVSTVDLSGEWEIVVSDEFKQQYDKYLALLGQPVLIRSVALSIVGLTTEETVQRNDGRELFIRGRNVRGCWERSLTSSGADETSPEYEAVRVPIVTADSETVYSEAWWEDGGTVHRSWLRGVQKYGGGDFESRRYLDGDMLVCESTFHPADASREKASITWRFKRQKRNPT
jgi:hypothetical protein